MQEFWTLGRGEKHNRERRNIKMHHQESENYRNQIVSLQHVFMQENIQQ